MSQQSVNQSKKTTPLIQKVIFPVSLITLGFLMSKSDFEIKLQKDLRNQTGDDFYLSIDNYTRYAPVFQMYSADILGVKSKNHWFDQTKNLFISSLVTNGVTAILKNSINKRRPGGSDNINSFPSAHTSMAFANATVLYEEFKDSSLVLAYSGYLFAITTGGLRMANNAHFLSDVLAGAGVGILITKLVYHFDPIIKWNPFKKETGVTFIPQFNKDNMGFYLAMTF